jgi:hypothetical protein
LSNLICSSRSSTRGRTSCCTLERLYHATPCCSLSRSVRWRTFDWPAFWPKRGTAAGEVTYPRRVG